MNIWILAVILGFALMLTLFFVLILLDRKAGNIDYLICQTFLQNQKWYTVRGKVDVKNDGTFMAEHIIITGGKKPIGLFHQKHLKPSKGNRYMMILEEWDVGRYRPLEYEGHIYGQTEVIKRIPIYDAKGNVLKGSDGKIVYKDLKDIIDQGLLRGTPNHDIDWILRRKEKNRIMLIKKDENKKWLPMIASAGVLIIVAIFMVFAAYYLVQYSENLEAASKNFNPTKQTQDTVEIIKDLLFNETIQDRVKSNVEGLPPSER